VVVVVVMMVEGGGSITSLLVKRRRTSSCGPGLCLRLQGNQLQVLPTADLLTFCPGLQEFQVRPCTLLLGLLVAAPYSPPPRTVREVLHETQTLVPSQVTRVFAGKTPFASCRLCAHTNSTRCKTTPSG
jgi:hypothetical protein